jgi:hypothetical protein
MTSSQIVRDPLEDHLLTPRNAALLIIDFQPVQVSSIASMDRRHVGGQHRRGGQDGQAV